MALSAESDDAGAGEDGCHWHWCVSMACLHWRTLLHVAEDASPLAPECHSPKKDLAQTQCLVDLGQWTG